MGFIGNFCLCPRLFALSFLIALCGAGAGGKLRAGEVRFEYEAVEFSESVGVAFVWILRTSTEAGEQVAIQTVSDSAIPGVDYGAIDVVYTFDSNRTEVLIPVQIFDNARFESDREFKVSLNNPVGVELGSPAEVRVLIRDNDDELEAGRGAAGSRFTQGTFSVATNSSGAILLGGSFDTFNGEPRRNIVRLLADEQLDPAFDVGAGANNNVVAVAVEADDQILIAGDFTEVDGVARNRIARLDGDGAVDGGFDPGAGADDVVESIELLPNDKILVAGSFGNIDDTVRSDVAILNPDGELDSTFNAVTPPSFFGQIARYSNGKIILGGRIDPFASDANVTNLLMRYNMTGERDNDFEVRIGNISDIVWSVVIQPDEKILVSGSFLSVDGMFSPRIARLNPDGSFDSTFDVGNGANDWVFRVTLQSDGKILLGGLFTAIDGVSRRGVARLHLDGSVDLTFDPGSGTDDVTYHALPGADGGVLLTGGFTSFDGYDRFRFARLNADGSLRTTPPSITSARLGTPGDYEMKIRVEPGRDFRLFETGDFVARMSVMTNRTARRIFDISRPADGSKKFFYVEQGF